MSKPGPWLVAPLPELYVRRSVAYWGLLYLTFVVLRLIIGYSSGQPRVPGRRRSAGRGAARVTERFVTALYRDRTGFARPADLIATSVFSR